MCLSQMHCRVVTRFGWCFSFWWYPNFSLDLPASTRSCVSERLVSDTECEGRAQNEMGECRMDIVNSEIAYLGYYGSEAYGLTWKVRYRRINLRGLLLYRTHDLYMLTQRAPLYVLRYVSPSLKSANLTSARRTRYTR